MKYIVMLWLALPGAVVAADATTGRATFYQQFYDQCLLGQLEHPRNRGAALHFLQAYCSCVSNRVATRVTPELLAANASTAVLTHQHTLIQQDAAQCLAAVGG